MMTTVLVLFSQKRNECIIYFYSEDQDEMQHDENNKGTDQTAWMHRLVSADTKAFFVLSN